MKAERLLELVVRLGLGGLFIYAGGVKLPDLQQFFLDVHHFEITPWNISIGVAMFLPWLEIVAGIALIVRRLYLGAITVCLLMSLTFIVAISSAWARGLDLTCGCFGRETNKTNYPRHLAMNGGMLSAAVILASLARRRSSDARSGTATA
jgi:putative oxidoreductase